MTKLKIEYIRGATPIEPDELDQLIPDYISKMSELNLAEQSNITDAFVWSNGQDLKELLSVTFLLKLHLKMFGQVWKWAGKQRRTNKNIGVMKENIMDDLGQLLKNVEYWIGNDVFEIDELATRFHHRLVQIHVFANGNGRHARLATDLLLKKLGEKRFSWGLNDERLNLNYESEIRTRYIEALRTADKGDFSPLLKFVRS